MNSDSCKIRIVLSCAAAFALACSDASAPGDDRFELAFARSDKGSFASDIYVSRADGSHATRLTTNAYAGAARWSPDGTKIAFSTNTQYTFVELINADGTDRHILTGGGSPAWSPDGTQVGYTGAIQVLFPGGGGKLTPVDQIFTVEADGSNVTRIGTDTIAKYMGSWSPDGTRIAFSRSSIQTLDDETIFVMAADGTSQVRLTDNVARNGGPEWSPTGARIAFVSWRDGNTEIYAMNPDGSGQTRLTNAAGEDVCPSWSPDGSRIAFTSNRDGFFQTYIMDADGTNQVRIASDFSDTCPTWKAP
jgi:Tol biopolymer transport system component